MKFLIVTPSFNRATYLDDTIQSVVTQEGDFEIEYIIQDGGANDQVTAILANWDQLINSGHFSPRCSNLTFRWYSEKDNGMYDAINKGFSKSSGDIMAWINTDDKYHSCAFKTIARIFAKYEDVYWITGIPNSYNEQGSKVGMDLFPKAYSRDFIEKGFYDVKFLEYGFNWIQQESTFWRSSLWERAGGRLADDKKYAADFCLWQSFAKYADLVKVYSFLGGYRCHDDQITANPANYRRELNIISDPPPGLRVLHTLLNNAPILKKLLYNKHKGFGIFNMFGLKWEWMVGRTVRWSFSEKDWILMWEGIMD